MDMDVISLPVVADKKKLDSRFRLVTIVAQRAKELSFGAKAKIQSKYKKVTSQALLEATNSELEFLTGEEARTALDEAKKYDMRRMIEEKKREARIEELTELERDLKVYLHERGEKEGKEGLEELFSGKIEEEAVEPPKE